MDAAELIRDTCERALRNIGTLMSEDSSRRWLFAILKACHVDRARSARNDRSAETSLKGPLPDEP